MDIEELKTHAPLIPYIKKFYSDKIPIVRERPNIAFARCVWRKENTESLAFYANGTYKCFGCGEYGDIINLVQYMENLSFQEACKMIGDNVGYEVVFEPPNPIHEAYKDMMDNHTRRYWGNLQNNGQALRYLMFERGLSKETIDLFRLGLTDINEYQYRTDIGNISGKITFPILEHKRNKPKCVGVAYRSLTNEKPKYINDLNQESKERQDPRLDGVFIKGNLLYGLPMAYKSITERGYAILVEGYMDVISMHQAGIKNTIGAMGTSITEAQIKIISQLTSNVLLFMDNDTAGIDAMFKIIKSLYQANLTVGVCVLPQINDPADLCKKENFNYHSITNLIKANTKQGIELIVNQSVTRYESVATIERTKALNAAMPIIEAVQDPAIKEMYKSKLYKRLDMM